MPDKKSNDSYNVLWESLERSILRHDISQVRQLKAQSPDEFSVAITTNLFQQAFVDSVAEMSLDVIAQFVGLGNDLNRNDLAAERATGYFPINQCVSTCCWHRTKLLLELGADPNVADSLCFVGEYDATGSASQLKLAKLLLNHRR